VSGLFFSSTAAPLAATITLTLPAGVTATLPAAVTIAAGQTTTLTFTITNTAALPLALSTTTTVTQCPTPKVVLAFTPTAGATSYQFLRGNVSGGPYALLGTANSPSFTDATVVAGHTYYYVADEVNASGTSGYGPQVAVSLP